MTAINRRQLLQYAFLAMPLAFGGIPLYLYAPDFYATEVGLPLGVLASALLLLRVFDALSDPLWGWLSDCFPKYRNRILNVAFFSYLLGFVALFTPSLNPVPSLSLPWFCFAILLATSGYSILVIQINSLGASWSDSETNLVSINGHREAFGLIGLITASIAPAILLSLYSKAVAFSLLAALLAIFLVFSYLIFIQWLKGFSSSAHILSDSAQGQKKFPTDLLFQARAFFLIYGVSALASACPAVLIVFFVRDYLDLEAWTGLFLILYFLSGIIFMPLWKRLAEIKGSAHTWMLSMLLAILSFSGVLLLSEGSFLGFVIVCFASGIAFGADLTIPPTILAKFLHTRQSIGNAGAAYSVIAFLSKLALALSAGLVFWVLDIVDFAPNQENTSFARTSLLYCYGLLPLVLKLIAVLSLIYARGGKNDQEYSSRDIFNMDGGGTS